MKIMPRLLLLAIFLSSCGGPEIWIPQGSPRAAVTMAHVQYLESPPQRAHIVIGIITPKIGEYETLAEAVKVIRKEAANVSYSPIFGVIIPITICARCGGDSKYCTCAIVTAARGLPCGIQISGPPQDDRKITSRDRRRIIFISLGFYWSRRSAAKRKTEGKRVHQTAVWREYSRVELFLKKVLQRM